MMSPCRTLLSVGTGLVGHAVEPVLLLMSTPEAPEVRIRIEKRSYSDGATFNILRDCLLLILTKITSKIISNQGYRFSNRARDRVTTPHEISFVLVTDVCIGFFD